MRRPAPDTENQIYNKLIVTVLLCVVTATDHRKEDPSRKVDGSRKVETLVEY